MTTKKRPIRIYLHDEDGEFKVECFELETDRTPEDIYYVLKKITHKWETVEGYDMERLRADISALGEEFIIEYENYHISV